MHPLRLTALAVLLAFAVVWLAREYRAESPAPQEAAALSLLPDVVLPDLEGRPRNMSEWAGRPLIINFWATWCPPCRREIPLLEALFKQRSASGLQIIGIALEDRTAATRYLEVVPVSYPMLYGEDQGALFAESLGDTFVGLPFTAVVAPGGEILLLHSGELLAPDLQRIMAELDALTDGRRSVSEVRSRLQSMANDS